MRLLDKLAQSRAVVLDGGLATTLESYGCDLNTSLWSSEVLRTEVKKIEQAHQDFTHAGADIVLTSTYQASFPTFKKIGLSNSDISKLYDNAIDSIKNATHDNQVIVGSLGPYGAYLSDGSEYTGAYDLTNADYYQFHYQRIDALITRGIHDFVFETTPSFSEIKAIVETIIPQYSSENTFWISVTVDVDGNLSDGTPFETVVDYIKKHQDSVPVFGINCSKVNAVNKAIDKGVTSLPQQVAIYPNGGAIFNAESKTWSDNGEHEQLFEAIPQWIAQGVKVVGGCCQVSPQDIARIDKIVK
jgi:homocysteine S-methyltransferase